MSILRDNRTRKFFQSWDENSAYVLGFWWADGGVHFSYKKQSVSKKWAIYNTDEQIMLAIASLMRTNLTVTRRPNGKHLWKIVLNSEELFDFCFELVGSVRKSYTPLNVPDIPDEFFHHFVRGYFDGDGSICFKTYKNRHGNQTSALTTSFTAGNGTGEFLQKLRDAIRRFIPVGQKQITGKQSKKLVFNQYDSMLLCEWMYQDATIFIDRKKAIWDSTDKQKLAGSKKYFSNKV